MSYFEYRTKDGAVKQQLRSHTLHPLAPTEVRLRVLAAGLNFRDLYFIRGNHTRAPVSDRIPLTDAVGIVESVGKHVTRFRVGDRVCSTVLPNWIDGPLTAHGLSGSLGSQERDGVMAEHLTMDEQELVAAPAHLTDSEAATLTVAALTAWHAVVELGALRPGDTVVIQTTGGVAVFAIQFAVALGASVIVVSRSEDKLRMAQGLGAHSVINSNDVPSWEEQVMLETADVGAQLVLDMGLSDSLRRSARAAAFEGTVAIIGVVQTVSNPLDIFPVMNKNLRVRGVETGSRAMFERMNKFIEAHQIRPVVVAEFNAEQIDRALDCLANGPFGKVVVRLVPPPAISVS
ncbi:MULTISPECIES: NAD(P)-dependent alcohol dehydrogenase [unclassified Pseudomonas]|uniref:zinc-dependent alcohol dehydrogenase family protein n=1 Tax=unclassified Pseudomonas TaxID=196821 RepID=UPI000C2F88CE|nr:MULTISPECIES: NAD(P)-dependent alcohol dehydrogenase [unclassified Pseudomonas]MCU1737978.1 NAD(P)-dependent alcohol dehydrogenase [Pseudomonas sp. 20S_6.2_Bac1]